MNQTLTSPYVRSTAGFPSNVHDETDVIRRKVIHLNRLAHAAAVLGNDRLADELFDIAQHLEGVETSIRMHIVANLQDGYQSAMAGVGGVLSAMAQRAAKEDGS